MTPTVVTIPTSGAFVSVIALAAVAALAAGCAENTPTAEETRALTHDRFHAIAETMAASKPEGWTEAGHRYLDEYFNRVERIQGVGDPHTALAHALLQLEADFGKGSLDYEDYPVLEPVPEPVREPAP